MALYLPTKYPNIPAYVFNSIVGSITKEFILRQRQSLFVSTRTYEHWSITYHYNTPQASQKKIIGTCTQVKIQGRYKIFIATRGMELTELSLPLSLEKIETLQRWYGDWVFGGVMICIY